MPTDNNNANQMNDSNIGLPQQQNGAPQPGAADGGADPAVNTDGVNDVNVQQQNAGLIDDVTDGNFETGTNQQPINSLDDANNAFLRILQGGSAAEGTGEQPVTEPVPNGTEGNAGTEPTASEGTNNSDPTAGPTATGTEPNTIPPINAGLDESQIQSMINDAIQREIENGNLADLSAQDMTSQLNGLYKQQQLESAANNEPQPQDEPELDVNSDEFFEMFSENPTEAIDKLTNARVQQKLAPLLEKLEPLLEQSQRAQENKNIIDTIKAFGSEHPDFGEYNDDMIKILNEGNFPKNDINSYRNAYQTAKNNRLARKVEQLQNQLAESEQNRGKSLDDYLKDAGSFDSLRHNEELKKAIVEDYIKDLSKGGTPQMISSGGSAQPNAMPADKPKDFRDAGEKFKKMLQS